MMKKIKRWLVKIFGGRYYDEKTGAVIRVYGAIPLWYTVKKYRIQVWFMSKRYDVIICWYRCKMWWEYLKSKK